jgi:uncharacterized membrane protein YedE/YeeE
MKLLTALIAGLVFGTGIAISGMINPAKVLNFFDLAGSWDPSLIFVMGGALVTAAIGYRVVFGALRGPLFEPKFSLPTSRDIDAPLIAGSAVFGIGWGLAGFCPGGAIPALGLGDSRAILFVAAMAAGLIGARSLRMTFSKFAKA